MNRWNWRLRGCRLLELRRGKEPWRQRLKSLLDAYGQGQFNCARKLAARLDKAIEQELDRLLQVRAKGPSSFDPETNSLAADLAKLADAIKQRECQQAAKLAQLCAGGGRRPGLEGKLCLIGLTATGNVDGRRTPVGNMPGVLVIGSAINTLLWGCYLWQPPFWSVLLASLLLAPLFLRLQAYLSALVCAVALAGLLLGPFFLLEYAGTMLGPITPLSSCLGCCLSVTAYRWWRDRRQKRALRSAFGYCLHPALVERICDSPGLLRVGGEEKELTVLFSDIGDFSSVAEPLSATELVGLLNECLPAMTAFVLKQQRYLDKYIGDAIMAVYGAPVPSDRHAERASKSALVMHRHLAELQAQRRMRGLPVLRMGVRINTGRMVVGNMGSGQRLKYTAIGDAVNLAARLEGINKRYGTRIIVSEYTWEQVRDLFVLRELDLVRVKGKRQRVRIFELIGETWPNGKIRQRAQLFEQGLQLYRERDWPEAKRRFERAAILDAEDRASVVYAQRCEEFIASPPPAEWDGVFEFKAKWAEALQPSDSYFVAKAPEARKLWTAPALKRRVANGSTRYWLEPAVRVVRCGMPSADSTQIRRLADEKGDQIEPVITACFHPLCCDCRGNAFHQWPAGVQGHPLLLACSVAA